MSCNICRTHIHTIVVTFSKASELQEFRVDILFSLVQNSDEVPSLSLVVGSEESVSRAGLRTPSGTPDAVDVVFRGVGVVVVDDVFDVFNVQPASSDVGGHKNGALSVSEFVQHEVTFLLRLVTVDADCLPSGVHNFNQTL